MSSQAITTNYSNHPLYMSPSAHGGVGYTQKWKCWADVKASFNIL